MPPVRPSVFPGTGPLLCAALACALLVACGASGSPTPALPPASSSPPPGTVAPSEPDASAVATSPSSSPGQPAAGLGFEFTADAVAGFYEGEGLTCGTPAPSRTAAGWSVTTCQGSDPSGRRVVVGLITDEAGALGAGFAAVTALPDEDLLDPTDALDPLSGFLGAMLGTDRATDLLPWLAGNLGNEYEETVAGELTVATYLETPDDPTRIFLEIDSPAYLEARPPG